MEIVVISENNFCVKIFWSMGIMNLASSPIAGITFFGVGTLFWTYLNVSSLVWCY